jgi:hypothetical protein
MFNIAKAQANLHQIQAQFELLWETMDDIQLISKNSQE